MPGLAVPVESEVCHHAVPDACLEGMALALRDFFSSTSGAEMEKSFLDMREFRVKTEILASKMDYRVIDIAASAEARLQAEYAFNRLFVGPGPVAAPPYASVYLDAEPRLMGEATAAVRELMRELGLTVRREGQEPEDHISCELELWLVLVALERRHRNDQKLHAGVEEALHWLEEEHFGRWFPLFIARVREDKEPTPWIGAVMSCLATWLHYCRRRKKDERRYT